MSDRMNQIDHDNFIWKIILSINHLCLMGNTYITVCRKMLCTKT